MTNEEIQRKTLDRFPRWGEMDYSAGADANHSQSRAWAKPARQSDTRTGTSPEVRVRANIVTVEAVNASEHVRVEAARIEAVLYRS
jgi:hypothetical protein